MKSEIHLANPKFKFEPMTVTCFQLLNSEMNVEIINSIIIYTRKNNQNFLLKYNWILIIKVATLQYISNAVYDKNMRRLVKKKKILKIQM